MCDEVKLGAPIAKENRAIRPERANLIKHNENASILMEIMEFMEFQLFYENHDFHEIQEIQ